MIRSPFDVELNVNRKEKTCRINQNQRFFNTFINMRWNEFEDTDLHCVLLIFNICLLDEPVLDRSFSTFL